MRGIAGTALVLGVAFALLATPASSVAARPGTLDPAFGQGGMVTTPLSAAIPRYAVAGGGAVEPDGRVVIAGATATFDPVFGGDLIVARYNPDGSLDPSFGSGGFTTTALGGSASARATAVEPDGKILVAGRLESGSTTVAVVVRYDADGSLDGSFGSGGIATLDLGGDSGANALALQADGRILVSGEYTTGGQGILVVGRLDPDGSADASFGSGGVTATNVGAEIVSNPSTTVAVESDGDILAGGLAQAGVVLTGYTPQGSPDPSFGAGGKTVTTLSGPVDTIAAQLDPDGRYVVGLAGLDGLSVIRYDSHGSLDPTFGSGGVAVAGSCCSGRVALGLQADGKIVVSSAAEGGPSFDAANYTVARLDSDGTLDSGFGAGGVSTTALHRSYATVAGVAADPGGRVLVIGDSGDCVHASHVGCDDRSSDLTIEALSPSGSPDASFGNVGTAITSLGTVSVIASAEAKAVLVQPDRKIVVVGRAATGFVADTELVRYRPDGSLDQSFGDGGETPGDGFGEPLDARLLPTGKILVLETSGLVRYDADGSVDTSFGDQGLVAVKGGVAVARQADGKLIVARRCCGQAPALFRYRPSGALDRSFGTRGKAKVRTNGLTGLVVERGGPIVVAGATKLAAITRSGTVDRAFGHRGVASVPIGPRGALSGIVRVGRRGLLALGHRRNHLTLFRYHGDGTLDRDFGRRGTVLTRIPVGFRVGKSAAVQPDGKLVIARTVDSSFGLVRFKRDGGFNRAFGDHGRIRSSVAGIPTAVAVAPARRLIVAGNASVPTPGGDTSQLRVARFRR
jgi:uncharacterized delta-60 repeat protein